MELAQCSFARELDVYGVSKKIFWQTHPTARPEGQSNFIWGLSILMWRRLRQGIVLCVLHCFDPAGQHCSADPPIVWAGWNNPSMETSIVMMVNDAEWDVPANSCSAKKQSTASLVSRSRFSMCHNIAVRPCHKMNAQKIERKKTNDVSNQEQVPFSIHGMHDAKFMYEISCEEWRWQGKKGLKCDVWHVLWSPWWMMGFPLELGDLSEQLVALGNRLNRPCRQSTFCSFLVRGKPLVYKMKNMACLGGLDSQKNGSI